MKMKHREGSTLVMTLMVFAILMILGTVTLNLMLNENKQSIHHQNKTQAYYIARSGAVAVEAAIINELTSEMMSMIENEIKVVVVKYINHEGVLVEIPVEILKNPNKLEITSTGTVNNITETVTKTLEIQVAEVSDKLSIDHAVFSHGDVKLSNGIITGNVGTNGNIKVDGNTKINGYIYIYENSLITHNGNNSSEHWWFKNNNIHGKVKKLEEKIIYPPQIYPDYFNGNPIDMISFPEFPNYNNNPENLAISPDISNEKTIDTSSRYKKITMGWNKLLVIDARYKNIDIWVEELTNIYKVVIKGNNKVNIHIKSEFKTNSNGKPFNIEGNAELNIYYSGKGGNFTTNNGGNEMNSNLYLNPSSPGIKFNNISLIGDVYVYNGDFTTGGSSKGPRVIGDIYSLAGNISIPNGDVEGNIQIHEGDFIKSSGGSVTGDIYLNKGDATIPNGNSIGNIYIYEGNYYKTGTGNIIGNLYLNKGNVTMPNGNVEGSIYLKQGDFTKTGSGNITGNVYQDEGELDLSGSGYINGSVITNGKKVIIKGAAKIADGIVYAPNADVKLTGSGSISGALIANLLSNEGGSSITYNQDIIKDNIDLINPNTPESNESTTSILKPGYFK